MALIKVVNWVKRKEVWILAGMMLFAIAIIVGLGSPIVIESEKESDRTSFKVHIGR